MGMYKKENDPADTESLLYFLFGVEIFIVLQTIVTRSASAIPWVDAVNFFTRVKIFIITV